MPFLPSHQNVTMLSHLIRRFFNVTYFNVILILARKTSLPSNFINNHFDALKKENKSKTSLKKKEKNLRVLLILISTVLFEIFFIFKVHFVVYVKKSNLQRYFMTFK